MPTHKLPTDQQLAQVHRELEELLHESRKRSVYQAALRGYGIKSMNLYNTLGDTKPFMFPTMKGWKVAEKE